MLKSSFNIFFALASRNLVFKIRPPDITAIGSCKNADSGPENSRFSKPQLGAVKHRLAGCDLRPSGPSCLLCPLSDYRASPFSPNSYQKSEKSGQAWGQNTLKALLQNSLKIFTEQVRQVPKQQVIPLWALTGACNVVTQQSMEKCPINHQEVQL